jgi:esterase/lipase superfamily enzyme
VKLAQLISLASFSSNRYSLWCFDWPGGTPFSFSQTREESGSEKTEAELIQFLRVLIDSGCQRIHIIGHSMGCRVVTNLGRNGGQGFSSLFREVKEPAEGKDTNKAELATFILFNPEILLNDFILNRFAGTRKYCSAVTVYADRSDNALRLAELIGQEPTLGRNPHMVLTRDSQGKARYLDIDIIDNTSLEQNINAIRHSYFALNTMLINDLRDQIHLGLGRAKDRSRLRRRVGNVWAFLVAPSAAT